MHDQQGRQGWQEGHTGLRDTGTDLLPRPMESDAAHAAAYAQSAKDTNAVTEARQSAGWRAVLITLAVCLGVGLLIYLGIHARSRSERQLAQATDAVAIPMVRVTRPEGASGAAGAAEVVLPANVTAYIDTPIYARTSGYLLHWYFDIGAHVPKGALLAVIQTPELDQQVMQAEQDVKTAESNLQLAQITATRWQKLLAKNAVSHQEADEATSDLASRQSALAAQQANVRRLQQMQGFERIEAPFAGVITQRNIDVGALIEQGQNSTQKELFHLAATDRLRLFVPVPEVYQSAVKNGARVAITLDAFPNEKFFGTLTRNSNAVDPLSRTLNAEVDVSNTTGKLLPGAYAFVHLPLPMELQALRVPSNTLLFRSQGMQVGVVQDGRVVLHDVKIGHDYGATVQILAGLKATDEIVLDPSDSLESGDKVRVRGQSAGAEPDGRAAQ